MNGNESQISIGYSYSYLYLNLYIYIYPLYQCISETEPKKESKEPKLQRRGVISSIKNLPYCFVQHCCS